MMQSYGYILITFSNINQHVMRVKAFCRVKASFDMGREVGGGFMFGNACKN